MLQQNVEIEGLSSFEDHEFYNDTHPGQIITKFYVVSEELPYESNLQGIIVRKNFVWVSRTWDLGHSAYARRVHDRVEFDEKSGKWIVHKLAPELLSDIRKNPIEWNAFYSGVKAPIVGVPIEILFKHDPSRAEFYKDHHIETIEQLTSLNNNNIQDLGMGVNSDVTKGLEYLKKLKEQAPAIELNAKLEEKEKKINSLQSQLTDLSAKLTELLNNQIEDTRNKNKKKE